MASILRNRGKLLFTTSGQHQIYYIDFNILRENVDRWYGNREPDEDRVQEIVSYLQNEDYVPPYLFLAEINGKDKLYCYDGSHRLKAFMSSDYEGYVIVDLLSNATQRDVMSAFKNVNKTVPISKIYIDEDLESQTRGKILQEVSVFKSKYKNMSSNSTNYQRPHFNIETLTSDIYSIWEDLNTRTDIQNVNVETIMTAIENVNIDYSNNPSLDTSYLKKDKLDKCRKNGLWLFVKDKHLPKEDIVQKIIA